jgi:ribosomal protein L37AE/L43A
VDRSWYGSSAWCLVTGHHYAGYDLSGDKRVDCRLELEHLQRVREQRRRNSKVPTCPSCGNVTRRVDYVIRRCLKCGDYCKHELGPNGASWVVVTDFSPESEDDDD